MSLDYFSSFTVVLRGVNENIDICQTEYRILSKLEFPLILKSYIEVQHSGQKKGNKD